VFKYLTCVNVYPSHVNTFDLCYNVLTVYQSSNAILKWSKFVSVYTTFMMVQQCRSQPRLCYNICTVYQLTNNHGHITPFSLLMSQIKSCYNNWTPELYHTASLQHCWITECPCPVSQWCYKPVYQPHCKQRLAMFSQLLPCNQ
jgi:hypothetical protein